MEDISFFDKYFIVVIDKNGDTFFCKRFGNDDRCRDHCDAYSRNLKIYYSIINQRLNNFNMSSSGFQWASVLNYLDCIVIWPIDINHFEFHTLISLPKKLSVVQKNMLRYFCKTMSNFETNFKITRFNNLNLEDLRCDFDIVFDDDSYANFIKEIWNITNINNEKGKHLLKEKE